MNLIGTRSDQHGEEKLGNPREFRIRGARRGKFGGYSVHGNNSDSGVAFMDQLAGEDGGGQAPRRSESRYCGMVVEWGIML